MKDYTLSVARLEDVQDIQDLIYPGYFNETVYRTLDYDPLATNEYIKSWLDQHCIIARHKNGRLVAVMAFYFGHTYYKQKECDVVIFYIHPDHRGTGLSRLLVDLLDTMCKEDGNVGTAYSTSGSGMIGDNDRLYANLFKKYGFKVLGSELIKVFENE